MGSCPALTFRITGQPVWTTNATEFKKGPCKDISNGSEVKLEGRRMSDGTIRADEIELKRR